MAVGCGQFPSFPCVTEYYTQLLYLWFACMLSTLDMPAYWTFKTHVLGIRKTTLRIDDLIVGITGLKKGVVLTVIVYYSEKLQITVSEGKRCLGQSPGETRCKIPGISFQLSYAGTHLILPARMWQLMRSVANLGSTLKPWCPGFLLRSVMGAWLTSDAQTAPPHSPPQAKTGFHHEITLLGSTCVITLYSMSKALGICKHSHWTIFQGLRAYLPRSLAKGQSWRQVFLSNVQGLGITGLLS